MSSDLPPRVYELLSTRIDSFEKLELVAALAAAPRSTLSVDELARMLNLGRDEIRHLAMELRAASLVQLTSNGEVQLLPPTSADHATVQELVTLYRDDRFTVVKTMGEISLARIRSLASRAFADAFIIGRAPKKRPKDETDE